MSFCMNWLTLMRPLMLRCHMLETDETNDVVGDEQRLFVLVFNGVEDGVFIEVFAGLEVTGKHKKPGELF